MNIRLQGLTSPVDTVFAYQDSSPMELSDRFTISGHSLQLERCHIKFIERWRLNMIKRDGCLLSTIKTDDSLWLYHQDTITTDQDRQFRVHYEFTDHDERCHVYTNRLRYIWKQCPDINDCSEMGLEIALKAARDSDFNHQDRDLLACYDWYIKHKKWDEPRARGLDIDSCS